MQLNTRPPGCNTPEKKDFSGSIYKKEGTHYGMVFQRIQDRLLIHSKLPQLQSDLLPQILLLVKSFSPQDFPLLDVQVLLGGVNTQKSGYK